MKELLYQLFKRWVERNHQSVVSVRVFGWRHKLAMRHCRRYRKEYEKGLMAAMTEAVRRDADDAFLYGAQVEFMRRSKEAATAKMPKRHAVTRGGVSQKFVGRPEALPGLAEKAAPEPDRPVVNCDQEAWLLARLRTLVRMATVLQQERRVVADNLLQKYGFEGILQGTAIEIIHSLGLEPGYVNLRKPDHLASIKRD